MVLLKPGLTEIRSGCLGPRPSKISLPQSGKTTCSSTDYLHSDFFFPYVLLAFQLLQFAFIASWAFTMQF